jgi:hypothetical protein
MARRDNEYPTVLEIMGDFLMSTKKTEELQEFLKNQENFLLKDEGDSEEEPQEEEEPKLNGGYFTEDGEYVALSTDNSPPYKIGYVEGDGYYGDGWHVSEDGEDLEIFYEMGRAGDENDDPIRAGRTTKGVNDDQAT